MASSAEERKVTREKVRAYRARLRAEGLRPIQIWVPDVRTLEFKEATHRQAAAVAASAAETADQAFIDAVFELDS